MEEVRDYTRQVSPLLTRVSSSQRIDSIKDIQRLFTAFFLSNSSICEHRDTSQSLTTYNHTLSSSWMKLHGISFRRILPKMVSPPGAAWAAFSTSDIEDTAVELTNLRVLPFTGTFRKIELQDHKIRAPLKPKKLNMICWSVYFFELTARLR